ncbi:hypothetical protein JL720_3480 [Aureococcus anophagefferens]|nr:hypothetical protein JL720_3480 [Aureococcus anophagefferens]
MVPAPEASRVALRVRREDRTRKAVHVARDAVTSFTVVRKALLGALGTDMDIWFPLPLANARPGDDAWRRVLADELAWRRAPKRAIEKPQDWADCLKAWDDGAKDRYASLARNLSNAYAVAIEDGAKRPEALLCAWEFAHESANARAATDPFLGRVVRAAEDEACRGAALRAAWMLAETDADAGTRLLKHGLADRLVMAAEACADDGAPQPARFAGRDAVGCLVALARSRPAVRDGTLARRAVAGGALRTWACRGGALAALGALVDARLGGACDETAAATLGLLASDGDARAAGRDDRYPGASDAFAACLDLCKRSSDNIDAFGALRVGAFAAHALAELRQEKNDGEVWDLLRELPELVVAARDAAPEEKRSAYEPVINALVAASGFALERGAPVEDLCGWVDATLGRLLPVVDRSAQLSAGYALYKLGLTPHGRSALLKNVFRQNMRSLDPDVLTPVGATLERLSRDATYDPCHPDEAHCEWRDRAHTFAFCRALASVGKALRNKLREEKLAERRGPELDRNLPSSRRERGRQRGAFLMKAVRAKRQCGDVFDVVATVCVTVARLARGWATSAAAHGLVREESPLLGRTTLYTLCRCIPLLLARKHGGSLAAAVSGFRVLACGADRVFRNRRGNRVDGNPVELLLDKGSLEVAVMSILKRGERWDRDRDELRPGYGDDDADDAAEAARVATEVQVRRETLEIVWKLATGRGGVLSTAGLSPALVKPLRSALRSDHAYEDSRSEDARERSRGLLAAAATTILLRFCSDSVPHAEELERLGSDVIAECLAALEPGRNDDVAKAALFSMQKMSARDHRLRLLFAARCAERLGELANRSRGADIQVEALHVLMNLSVALEACGAVARHALLPALEVAAASEPEVRAFAVSLLANLSRDARCNRLHLHKLRRLRPRGLRALTARRVADRGATARGRDGVGGVVRRVAPRGLRPRRPRGRRRRRRRRRAAGAPRRPAELAEHTASTAGLSDAAREKARAAAARHLRSAPNSLWLTTRDAPPPPLPRAPRRRRRAEAAAARVRARGAPRGRARRRGRAADRQLPRGPRGGRRRDGVDPWAPEVAGGCAAKGWGKRCVLAPGGARNTFLFPAKGRSKFGDCETRLVAFKAVVGSRVGDGAPIYLIPGARSPRGARRRPAPAAAGRRPLAAAARASSALALTLNRPEPPPSSSSSSRTDDDDEPSLATTASEAADDYTAVHLYRRAATHHMPELVEAPDGDWGRLPLPELALYASKKAVVVTERRKNAVAVPLWVVDNSIFAPRKGESDAKAFYDTPKVRQRMFAKDWAYLTGLPRFPKFAARLGGAKRGKEASPAVQAALADGARRLYDRLIAAHTHYATRNSMSSNPFDVTMTSWLLFLKEARLIDERLTVEDAQRIFINCNVEHGASKELAAANDDDMLIRYEFVEAALRVIDARYGLEDAPPPGVDRAERILEAVDAFTRDHLDLLPPETFVDPDDFRREELYTEDCDRALRRHDGLLKQLHLAFALTHMVQGRPSFSLAEWYAFLTKAGILDTAASRVRARRAFVYSRTSFVDNTDARFRELSYTCFLEALCRFVGRDVPVPSDEALEEVGAGECLAEFYESLWTSSNGGDALKASHRLRRLLEPDPAMPLARKLGLVLPHAVQNLAVAHRGDLRTKLSTVRLAHALSKDQQAKWLGTPGIHITRASIDHLFVDLSQQAAKLKRRAAEKAAGGH